MHVKYIAMETDRLANGEKRKKCWFLLENSYSNYAFHIDACLDD